MTPLRCQMIEDLAVRGLAENTHRAYLHAVTQLAQYYNRRPDQLSIREVQRFLVHLHEERGLAWSSCNLYGAVFGQRRTGGEMYPGKRRWCWGSHCDGA